MSNVAYTEEYKLQREQFYEVFDEKYFRGMEIIDLLCGYVLKKRIYEGMIKGCNLTAEKCNLYDNKNNLIYSYESTDNNGTFCEIIEHSNGNKYMIFRQDLYGYCVLNIETKEDFLYFPSEVMSGKESFIWSGIRYNIEINLLLVDCCIWGATQTLLLLDFSKPMEENAKWIDINECIDGGYYEYEDLSFVRWDTDGLKIKLYSCIRDCYEEYLLSNDKCLMLLKDIEC